MFIDNRLMVISYRHISTSMSRIDTTRHRDIFVDDGYNMYVFDA